MRGFLLAAAVSLLPVGCGGGGETNAVGGATGGAGPGDAAPEASGDAPQDAPPDVEDAAPDLPVEAESWLGPPYPLVFAHGFFGFDEFAGVDFATYFYRVRETLVAEGEPETFTPAVDPFAASSARGAQLAEHVEAIRLATRRRKVVIIGHSQGGLDARVVAHRHADRVAAVFTLATPHGGSPVADVVLRLVPDPNAQGIIDAVVRLVGGPLYTAEGQDTSFTAALRQFSRPGIAAFNDEFRDSPDVAYYSLTGRSNLALATTECRSQAAPPFVTSQALERDGLDPLFSVFSPVFGLDPHDGMVSVQSAKWGTFLGCLPADHFDQVGHLFGDAPSLTNAWKYLDFYRGLVRWIRARGY